MRILFVISGLGLGGAERQIVLLSRELVRMGHQVSVYTLTGLVPRAAELDHSVDLVVDQKRMRLDVSVLGRLRGHILEWRADVVHGFLYDGNLYARIASLGLNLLVLNSERSDAYTVSPLQRIGYRATASLCDGVVANSYSGAAFAQRIQKLDDSRVHVVWNGIDLREIDDRLARSHGPANDIVSGTGLKRMCMVASIKPEKDHPLALRVMRCLLAVDPSWRLICVGDELSDGVSGYKATVMNEVRRLSLGNHVSFIGHRRDVPEIIASCDLLLVTSLLEGFPNVVLEAMSCGTAVVSTEYSDVRRILPLPEQVVGTRSEADVAAAILRCYGIRSDIVTVQRAWVEANATASASASRMLEVYRARIAASLNAPARLQ